MRLRITHDTRYDYTPAVKTALHLAHLQPVDTLCQRVLDRRLDVSPTPTVQRETADVYGNLRTFLELDASHPSLLVRASSLVETSQPVQPASRIDWQAARDGYVYSAGAKYQPASEFLFPSVYVHPGDEFLEYATPSFAPGRPLLDCARDLMARIHTEFAYSSNSTEINTPAAVALQCRAGVCQDFAHVMLACLRSIGVAARYVSGYLLTQAPPGMPKLVGSDASHAWVSVYLPDVGSGGASGGWHDLDPTNHRDGLGTPGEDYVRLAVGRDYADVSPMRGVIQGAGHHHLTVGVTVQPCDAATLAEAPPI